MLSSIRVFSAWVEQTSYFSQQLVAKNFYLKNGLKMRFSAIYLYVSMMCEEYIAHRKDALILLSDIIIYTSAF